MQTRIIKAALWLGLLLCMLWLAISVDYVGYLFAWLPLMGYMLGIIPVYWDKYMQEDFERIWDLIFSE